MGNDEDFLSRWSRRKHQASAGQPPAEVQPPAAAPPASSPAVPMPAGREPPPPIESLTPESDFTPFMAKDVDGDLRRKALKTLFSDPRFNVMDMMDVYVDDYSKPDPLPESWLGKLEQMSRLGDRAGRDREEEARRNAEREAAAATAAPAAGEGGDDGPVRIDASEADPPADGAAVGDEGEIPPQIMGESGT